MKEIHEIVVPFWDNHKLTGKLYRAVGYSREEEAPLEIVPAWGTLERSTLYTIKEMLGHYKELLNRQPDKEVNDVQLWNRDAYMGVWIDDYYCLGSLYERDHEAVEVDGEKDIEYTMTYLCEWMISKDLYGLLK